MKLVFRHCQMSPGKQYPLPLRTTSLGGWAVNIYISIFSDSFRRLCSGEAMTRTIHCMRQVCSRWQQKGCEFRDSSGLGADNWVYLGKACWCAIFQVSSLDTGGTKSLVGSSVLDGWFRKPGMLGAPVISPEIPSFIFCYHFTSCFLLCATASI